MYYLIKVEDKIRIPPRDLEMELEDAIAKELRERYENRIVPDLGFVLKIIKNKIKSDGYVIPGDPFIYYLVEFEALTFDLAINEVLIGDVKEVLDFGAFVNIGPTDALLHVSQIGGEKFRYDKKSKSFVSANKRTIKKGDIVLTKVSTVSYRNSLADSRIGLTMRLEGLGKEEWLKKKENKSKK